MNTDDVVQVQPTDPVAVTLMVVSIVCAVGVLALVWWQGRVLAKNSESMMATVQAASDGVTRSSAAVVAYAHALEQDITARLTRIEQHLDLPPLEPQEGQPQ